MSEHINYIGITNFRQDRRKFGIKRRDRRQHVYCIGKTGSGKTTLLKNLILQDIQAGHGVGVIDPHGDLAQEILEHIPPRRTDDVVYFNPADLEHPIGLNLLKNVPLDSRHLVASSVVSAFKNIWSDSWGPRLEYILYNALAALLDCENTTLLGVVKMLTDEDYRNQVVKRIQDPLVRSFWQNEYAEYDERFMHEAIAPIQNKVGQFLTNAPIRNILGQVTSTIDPGFMMNNRRILIANLSKGQLGEDKANLLGSLLVTQFQLSAMQRATIPEEERTDFYLYIDEFHNFTTDSFATILSEARKYRLNLCVCHQYLDQLSLPIRQAVLGNIGTLIAFRVGSADAAVLEREFWPTFTAGDLIALDRYAIYLKLLIDGIASSPFSAYTLPPFANNHGRRETIIRRSREKYGRPRAQIEDKIKRWMDSKA